MFNWLDIVLLVILAITLILGCIKGLVRQLVGILAVIIGMIVALTFYHSVGTFYRPLVSNDSIAHFLGFLSVFFIFLLLGWLVSRMFSKAMKGPFKFLNHVLGGFFGLLKGTLICGIIVFALLVFAVNTKALEGSMIAPSCLKMTMAVVDLVPQDLKDKFRDAYQGLIGRRGKNDDRE